MNARDGSMPPGADERAAHDAGEADRVRRVVARISAAWQACRFDDLASCFDAEMVIVAPGFQARVEGRAACVETYREFMERVRVTEYHESEPAVHVWGATAVASYRWEMAWDAGGTPNRDTGHDVLVFRRVQDGPDQPWRAVWRTIVAGPH